MYACRRNVIYKSYNTFSSAGYNGDLERNRLTQTTIYIHVYSEYILAKEKKFITSGYRETEKLEFRDKSLARGRLMGAARKILEFHTENYRLTPILPLLPLPQVLFSSLVACRREPCDYFRYNADLLAFFPKRIVKRNENHLIATLQGSPRRWCN